VQVVASNASSSREATRPLFYADITEVVHTHLNMEDTKLVVEWWTPAQGLRRMERE